jgi:hypothetical protein
MRKEERRLKKCLVRVLSPKEVRTRAYKGLNHFTNRWLPSQVAFSRLFSSRHHKQGDK